MALFVLVIGALLAAVGCGYLALGFDIVMTERGSAMTIGGAVALSGGIITMALGCALLRLTQILRRLETVGGPAAVADEPEAAPQSAGAAAAGLAAVGAGVAIARASVAAETAAEAGAEPLQAEHVAVPPAPPESVSSPSLPNPVSLDEIMAEIAAGDAAAPPMEKLEAGDASASGAFEARAEAEGSEVDAVEDAGTSDEISGEDAKDDPDDVDVPSEDAAEDEAPVTPLPALPGQPTVLGNYRAGGRTYTMYSNGSVEAVTEHGVERFESMQALRDHLART